MSRSGLLGVVLGGISALAVVSAALAGSIRDPGVYFFPDGDVLLAQGEGKITFTFVPPLRGAPTRRVSGATRSATSGAAPTIAVLAPETTSWTGDPDPTLYWYLGADSEKRFVFTLVDEETIDPVAEFDLAGPFVAGFQPISLAGRGLTLAPEIIYEWSVSLVEDTTERSNDVITSGTLQYKPLDPALRQELEAIDAETRLARLAQNGYWYDVIDLIAEQIANGRQADKWRAYRSQLLEQVGLPGV